MYPLSSFLLHTTYIYYMILFKNNLLFAKKKEKKMLTLISIFFKRNFILWKSFKLHLVSFPTAYLRLHLSSIVTSAVTSSFGLHVPSILCYGNVGNLPDVLNPSARFCAHPRAGREWTTNPQDAAPRLYHAGYSTLAPLFLVASILNWLWLSQSSPSYPIHLPFSLPSFLVIGFVGSILYFPPQLARCQAASRWARRHLLSSATDSRRFAASAMAS